MGEAGVVGPNNYQATSFTNAESPKGGSFTSVLGRWHLLTSQTRTSRPSRQIRRPCRSSLTSCTICISAPGSISRRCRQTERTCCVPLSKRPSLCSVIRMDGRGRSRCRFVLRRSRRDSCPTRQRGGRGSISSRKERRVFTIALVVVLLPTVFK